MINFYPKDHSSKITTLKALGEYISEIDNVDFHRMVDSSIEGAESFADEADKAVKNNASKAVQEIDGLWQELSNDINEEFTDKFNNYIFLVENKVEDIDDFPFRDWAEIFSSLKDKASMDYNEVLNNIDSIAKINKDNATYNIAAFLNVIQYNNIQISGLFPHLNKVINKHFPEAKLIDLLSANNYSQFVDALNGKDISLKENSHLFFEYAAFLPIESFAIRQNMSRHLNNVYNLTFSHNENNYPNSLGLDIPLHILDMNQIYSAFSKTEAWERIKDSEKFKKIFVKNLVKFYQGSINKHHIKNADNFIIGLAKDDTIFAELFFTELEKFVHGKEKEDAKINFENALKISLNFILEKEIPKSDIKIKKAKI